MTNKEDLKLSDMTPEEAYKLGKCEGTFEEGERWSKEIVPVIKESSYEKGYKAAQKAMEEVLTQD